MIRQFLSGAAGQLDRAVTDLITRSGRSVHHTRAESLGHDARMEWLARVREVYGREEFLLEPERFFVKTGILEPREIALRSFPPGGRAVDIRWRSRARVHLREVEAAYDECKANQTAVARAFFHNDRPRNAIVLVHGYRGGAWALEERVWPVQWFFERGLDVVLFVLPFHGVRGDSARRAPIFPASDPRITIEGFRQAIIDLGDLVDILKARGCPTVSAMGMSLGGYTVSLMATIDDRLETVIPMIPLASIADFAREQKRLVGTPAQQVVQHAELEAAHGVVSPLARESRVAPERVLVLAAEGDRITPAGHAMRIANHFSAKLEVFAGGHLIQLGRGEAFRTVARMMGARGLLDARRRD